MREEIEGKRQGIPRNAVEPERDSGRSVEGAQVNPVWTKVVGPITADATEVNRHTPGPERGFEEGGGGRRIAVTGLDVQTCLA